MAKKFSIANIIPKKGVPITTAQDIGQAIQIGANITSSIAATKKQQKKDKEQSDYFQANIAYRNRSTQFQEDMLKAGNDLNVQRDVMDNYNEEVADYSRVYKLNEKFTSQFASTVQNDSSKREERYRTQFNRQNRNIVESNITEVVANSTSFVTKNFVSTAKGLKEYAQKENFTPQQASQMIAKAYINSKLAGIDPQNITREQADAMLKEVTENLIAFDDRLVSDLIYKKGKATFTAVVAQVTRKERTDFQAVIKTSEISVPSMNEKIDFEVDRKIFSKEEGDLLKKQYRDRILKEEATAKAQEIALGVKGKKAKKELEKPIQDSFKNIINEMKSRDIVPSEISPDTLGNMLTYIDSTDATKAVLSVSDLNYLNNYTIRYKIKYDINAQENLIKSNSLQYSDNIHKGTIKKELGLIAQDAFSKGNMDTVEAIWVNHEAKGQVGNIITRGLQDSDQLAKSLAVFNDLENRGIASSLLDNKTYLTATTYDFIQTTDEEGNVIIPPDIKKIVDGYIKNPGTILTDSESMEEFIDVYGTTGSGNYLAKRREFRILVSLGADPEDLAEKMKADDEAYKPTLGVDLTGMKVDISKKTDIIEDVRDYLTTQDYIGFSYNPIDKRIYLSKVNDKFNRITEYSDIDRFLSDGVDQIRVGTKSLRDATNEFQRQRKERLSDTKDAFINIFFRKPTKEQIRAFTKSATR